MLLFKFVIKASAHKNKNGDMPEINNTCFVIANDAYEANQALQKNWREMSFKRDDKPTIEFLGIITQETTNVFNECELVKLEGRLWEFGF